MKNHFLKPDEELWWSPEWCDWRWRISGCEHAGLWKAYYIIHTIACYALVLLCIYLIYKRIYQQLYKKNLSLFDTNDGIVKPRSTEAFLVFSGIHLLGRGIYTTIVLADGFKNWAFAEFMHEWPWEALYTGCIAFTIGLIHATPKTYLSKTSDLRELSKVTKVSLPSAKTLNILFYVCNFLPPLTLPWFSVVDGHGRDIGDYKLASTFNSTHYAFWSLYCWIAATITIYFGVKMVQILRANVASGVGGKNEANMEQLKRAMKLLIITLLGVAVILVSFGSVLLIYAIWRKYIQSIFGVSVIVGTIWIFVTPLMIAPIYIVIAIGLWTKKPPSSANRSASVKASVSASIDQTRDSTKMATRASKVGEGPNATESAVEEA